MSTVLTNQFTGETKVVPTGFSWTTLFFGCFPALFRGDIMWAAVMFIAAICTMGFSWLVFPFIYNGLYVNRLVSKGFRHGQHVGQPQSIVQQVHVNLASPPTAA